MSELIRTNTKNNDFINLVAELDAYLALTDGDEHSFYDQFNKLDKIDHVIVAYANDRAVACGAIKRYDNKRMEIKRMYTALAGRRQGLASRILTELEQWARELGFEYCILETGLLQVAAIELYRNLGYLVIDNYGQYRDVPNSVCFQKKIKQKG